jgi:hypothetical protein
MVSRDQAALGKSPLSSSFDSLKQEALVNDEDPFLP